MALNAARTIRCKAWISPVGFPSRESESEFKPIFKENSQRQKQRRRMYWSKDFRIWTKMHLSTVQVPIDFGIDWPWSSVLFLISNQLFFSKVCVSYSFASFCIYLVRPSPVSLPHATWLCTYTHSYAYGQGPTMDRETVYLLYHGETIGFQPVSTRQLALDFTSCHWFSPY